MEGPHSHVATEELASTVEIDIAHSVRKTFMVVEDSTTPRNLSSQPLLVVTVPVTRQLTSPSTAKRKV